jgi:hypothetical protein
MALIACGAAVDGGGDGDADAGGTADAAGDSDAGGDVDADSDADGDAGACATDTWTSWEPKGALLEHQELRTWTADDIRLGLTLTGLGELDRPDIPSTTVYLVPPATNALFSALCGTGNTVENVAYEGGHDAPVSGAAMVHAVEWSDALLGGSSPTDHCAP